MIRRPGTAADRGFSLIELLVVILIIAALAGMTLPLLSVSRARGERDATAAVVQALATAVATHQSRTLTTSDSAGNRRIRRLWDINGDRLIDGDPVRENALPGQTNPFDAETIASGYRGLLLTTTPTIPKRFVDPATARPLDAWGRPLRLAWADALYGSAGFGIWSAGPDGSDDPATDLHDDIRSWETTHD